MEKRENKQAICDALVETLKYTRDANDVLTMIFHEDIEIVEIVFISGGIRRVNVAMDSGVAMIRDIMRGLGV